MFNIACTKSFFEFAGRTSVQYQEQDLVLVEVKEKLNSDTYRLPGADRKLRLGLS